MFGLKHSIQLCSFDSNVQAFFLYFLYTSPVQGEVLGFQARLQEGFGPEPAWPWDCSCRIVFPEPYTSNPKNPNPKPQTLNRIVLVMLAWGLMSSFGRTPFKN